MIFWWICLLYLPLTERFAKTFCKAFNVCYQDMYYIDYVGFVTCSQLFWEPCWEFFWSISQCPIRSIHLSSIHHENANWPNFFRRSCLRPIRTEMLSVTVDRKPFSQSKIRSIWVLRKIRVCYWIWTSQWKLQKLS